MIEVFRQNDKIIGIYKIYIDRNEILNLKMEINEWLQSRLLEEIKNEDNSELFTYKIVTIATSDNEDFFGNNYTIVFEFIPIQEEIDKLKEVTERLQIGL